MKTQKRIAKTKKCYICEKNEANSIEHIIPNAIGGKLKVKILCERCNSILGETIDASLAKSLLFFSNIVNHSRDNGKIPSMECEIISSDGKKIEAKRNANTKGYSALHISCDSDKNSLTLNCSALGDGIKQIKKVGKKALVSFGEKHGFDETKIKEEIEIFERQLETSKMKIEQPLVHVELCMGGKDVFLSCLKTAINFYIFKGHKMEYILNAIQILREQNDNVNKICNFYPHNIKQQNGIFHILYLKGDANSKKLFCVITYFNVFSVFVLLNSNYIGKGFEESYCYDIWNEKECDSLSRIDLTNDEINIILTNDEEYRKRLYINSEMCLKNFLEHFVVNKVTTDKGVKILTNFLFEVLHEILCSEKVYYNKNEFQQIFIKKATSKIRPRELKILKDKNIKDAIEKCIDFFFKEYQVRFTGILMTPQISTLITKVIMTEIEINGSIKKGFIEDIRSTIIKEIKTPYPELDVYVPECVNLILDQICSHTY